LDPTPVQRLVSEAFEECMGAAPLDDCPIGDRSRVKSCTGCLCELIFDRGRPAADYGCERRRWMYIVCNLPPAAWGTYEVLRLCRGKWEVVLDSRGEGDDGGSRMSLGGAGPGSKFMGALAWIDADGYGLPGWFVPPNSSGKAWTITRAFLLACN